jgi:tripartite-type tricarboxylate transporter receptor subunit TctC
MDRPKGSLFLLPLCGLVLAGSPAIAMGQAKAYPTKSITYLVTFDPGGQSDREARRQQPILEKVLGQKIVVDYKTGGGGALGWSELVNSKPDGYLMAGINIPHIILQPAQQKTGYTTEQIIPVALFQRTPLALAVLKTSPHKDLKGFLAAAKEKPAELTVGGSGTFSGHHVATLRLQKMAGTKFNYLPFTGAAPQMTAFLGNHVSAVFANSDDLVKYADSIRVLAVATESRFPGFPDAPTFRESGYDLVESIDRGVGLPPKTPESVVKTLEAALMQVATDPMVQEQMRKEGFVPLAMGHDETTAYIAKMSDIYKEVLKEVKK